MKRVLLAGIAFTSLIAGSALAADMPPSMPMPRAPALVPFFTWSGFYVGLNAGYAWGNSNWSNVFGSTGGFKVDGPMAGGTLGYNMQWGALLYGIETDFDWADIKGSTTAGCPGGCETKITWLGTTRGRLGYTMDRFLPYITGGVAYGNVKATATDVAHSSVKVGWTIGGGVEYAFMDGWTTKLEYLYVDLGSSTCGTAACGVETAIKFDAHLLRAGLNYKF